jgi:hypothetical protein
MKTKLMILAFLAGGTLLAQPVYVRPRYVAPAPVVMRVPPPAPRVSYVPRMPGPGYSWVAGYWYPSGPSYSWRAGYWSRPAFYGAHWISPRYYSGRYYHGYWRR